MDEGLPLLFEEFALNPARPIYEQFVEQIRARIVSGIIQSGQRLPSVREFAADKRVNPTTAARTYQELERSGLIVTYRGQGTFVTSEPEVIENARAELARAAVQELKRTAKALGLSLEEMLALGEEEE
ncbi:GntR family transcriptional regulator [Paenibacillus sp. CAU 1782]